MDPAKAWGFHKEALVSRGRKALLVHNEVKGSCHSSGLVSWLHVRLTRNIKSILSQFIFCQIVGQRLYRLWLLRETKTEFVLLIEPMGSSKPENLDPKSKLSFTHWLRFETAPQLSQKREQDLIWCKMHELVSKNKIGSPLVFLIFIPGKWVMECLILFYGTWRLKWFFGRHRVGFLFEWVQNEAE